MPTIAEIRENFPQYSDLDDAALASALRKKFYSDMSEEDFNARLGLAPKPTSESAPSALDSAALGALDTATFGFADEIGSGLDYVADRVLPGGQSRSYADILAANRKQQGDAQEANPGSYLTGQLAGGVGTGIGAAKTGLSLGANAATRGQGLGRVAMGSAADGAIYGGIHGAGSGEGVEGRSTSAATGAAAGMALGGAAPYATAGARALAEPLISPVAARLRPQTYAQKAIGEGLQRSGKTPDEIADSLSAARADGQDMYTAADAMGHSGRRMLSTVARTPNDARQEVVEALQRRQLGQSERLSSALAEGFDASDTAAQRAASLKAKRTEDANTNYGATRGEAKPVDVTRAVQNADLFLQPGSTKVLSPQTNIADDSVEAAVRRARSYLTDGRSLITDFDATFRAKTEIDAMIQGAKPVVQRHLKPIQTALDNALADASPNYASARDTFRSQSKAIEAVDTGRDAASSRRRAGDTIPQFKAMSPDEQSAFRAGYVDPLIARVEGASVSPTTNRARPLMTDKTAQEFPEFAAPGRADQLRDRISREQQMFETANAALGGSKTADNLADAAEMANFDPGVMSALFQGRPVQAVVSMAQKLLSEGKGLPPRVTETVARTLMETRPDVVRKIMADAASKTSEREGSRALANTILIATGASGTGRIAAP